MSAPAAPESPTVRTKSVAWIPGKIGTVPESGQSPFSPSLFSRARAESPSDDARIARLSHILDVMNSFAPPSRTFGETFVGFPLEVTAPELARAAHRVENWLRRKRYVKPPACRECSRDAICDGLEPAYAEALGTGELRPVPGPAETDPMVFRAPYAARWE